MPNVSRPRPVTQYTLPIPRYLGLCGNEDTGSARDATLAAAARALGAAAKNQAAAEAAAPIAVLTPGGSAAAATQRLTPLVIEPARLPKDKEYFKWRARLLICLRGSLRNLSYPLRLLDSTEISLAERVTAA